MDAEKILQQFVRLLPAPIFLIDGAGVILDANEPAAQMLRRPRDSLYGASLASLAAEPREQVAEYLGQAARSLQLIPGALTWRRADGSEEKVRCDAGLLQARDGDAPALVMLRVRPKAQTIEQFVLLNQKIADLQREIVERQRAERERDELLLAERAARQEAERVSHLKDEFLATLSHELRTPMNAILGWAQLLAGDEPSEADLREGLETIQRSARMQAQMIEDLLDMSRIVLGKVRLDVQRVDLAQVIQAAVDTVRPAADAKQLRLQVVLDPLAGPVLGDPVRLQQVIWNLLNNATKFTPKGARVQVLLERVNSHVEISVIDNGAGIAPDFLPHLFERFRQADASTTRQHGGLGLGLAIVRQLVELHGGTVRAKSPGTGQGAAFMVSLPLMLMHADEHAPARQHPTAAAATATKMQQDMPRLDGVRVLVVDDERDARRLMKRFLEVRGASVSTAGSVQEAIAALGQDVPDVILSDIGMPVQDGYEFIRQVRQLPADQGGGVPAAAVTAFARSDDRTRALLSGFQMHMAKPVDPVELLAAVASLAGRT